MTDAEALAALAEAKARGWDFIVHSSWSSALDVFIVRVRAPGQHAHAARTRVGSLSEVLHWGAAMVGEDER